MTEHPSAPTDWSEYQDEISDAISESIDMDWNANDGARAVVRWLNENKPLASAPTPSSLAGGEGLDRHELATIALDTGIAIGVSTWPDEQMSDALTVTDAILAALSPEAPAREGSVPADVAQLVIAARLVAFGDQPPHADDIKALDIASEAFADRVPWEDEPESHEAPAEGAGEPWGWAREVCTGCSASLTLSDIKARGCVSCCPDRRMIKVRDLVDAYEAALRARSSAPEAREGAQPVGIDPVVVETAIGGAYDMPDGRGFWIDGPVAREMTKRVLAALKAEGA